MKKPKLHKEFMRKGKRGPKTSQRKNQVMEKSNKKAKQPKSKRASGKSLLGPLLMEDWTLL